MAVTKTMTEPKEAKGSSVGVWVFRVLVVAAAVLMLVSWFQPWWTIHVEELGKNIVQIRPWGLEVDERMGSFDVLIKGAALPNWFAPLMWVYLVLCMIALLIGAWVRGKYVSLGRFKMKLAQFFTGGVGLSYILVGVIAAVYASIRLKGFYNTPLQGRVYVELGDAAHTYAESSLLLGFYLIFAAGLLLVLLAFFHDLITDEFEDEK